MQSKKRKLNDDSYFKCYADISIHEDMIGDQVRTSTYRRAILKNYKDFYGKVVLDVGCGTGILSMFCVQAGAQKVYAVEASDLATETRKAVVKNKMADKITVLHSRIEEAEITEKVDIIVSEWMGYFLLYETMLPSVLFARDKWLKKGGSMYPSNASIYLAPVADLAEFNERLAFWNEAGGPYKLDLTTFGGYTRSCMSHGVHIMAVDPSSVVSHPEEILSLDLMKITPDMLQTIQGQFKFICYGDTDIQGFVSWFNVTFPGDITLTTSPYKESTHWGQSVMYVKHPLPVKQDTLIKGNLTMSPNASYNRFLDINIVYEVDNRGPVNQLFLMDDVGS